MATEIIEHIPRSLLKEACEITALDEQEVVIAALRELIAKRQNAKLFSFNGSFSSSIEIKTLQQKAASL